ncbi:hypothetical protein CMT41_18230 [Colwellia sp. MT41]|uniref:glycosyltransferase n=1 Tax=Colwellia sp. MT41 TaxID=58049 RepID=UPI0007177113|nr:glycosyltransferase [Colwellia sp. MT41]ALO36463.1 hypothetical protein CMT41_18230 [Colwellia sp. MT41]
MNILTISTLYPNNKDPKHGVFVETRVRHLIADYPEINTTVIAPVPWFPFSDKRFGEYAKFSGVVSQEVRHGVEIHHPKYLVLPKIGMYLTPFFMSLAIKRKLKQLIKQGQQFDVIDGHYFYPDGVAIAQVAKEFSIPFTCTARGTDINLIPQQAKARGMIQQVFKCAAHLMTVCQALKDEMLMLGAKEEEITVLRNGVDLNLFAASTEVEQGILKKELGIDTQLVISVGWLIERKGHYLVIEALKKLTNVTLAIAGDGPDSKKLEKLVKKLGLEKQVKFLGSLSQQELNKWFKAADVTVLASSREGWANVLLESMASGTPVVATRVWGTPEVVASEVAGILVERDSHSIQEGLNQLLNNLPDRKLTREYAEKFDWHSTSTGQYNIFKRIIEQ